MPGTYLDHEVHVHILDGGAVVGHELAELIPGVLAPLVAVGSLRHRVAHLAVVGEGVGLVAVVHRRKEGFALGGDEVHQTPDGDFPGLARGDLGAGYGQLPRLQAVVILVVAVILEVGVVGVADRDVVYVRPGALCALGVAVAVGINVTHGCSPDVETLHELLCEVLEGGTGGCAFAPELGADLDGCKGCDGGDVVVHHVLAEA